MASGPGRADRVGISLVEADQKFGDKKEAEKWFESPALAERGRLPRMRLDQRP